MSKAVAYQLNGKTVPEGWVVRVLGDIGVFSKGKGILKDQVKLSGLPCIRYGEIYTSYDYTVKEPVSFIPENVAEESQEIKRGDILFAGSGETIEEIGKSIAYLGERPAYAGGDIIVLSPSDGIDTVCLSYLLETESVRKQKRKMGQGNAVVHIYSSDLKEIIMLLPPLPEQKAIAQLLSTWDEAIQKLTRLIAQKQQRKKWLMQMLLTGKKRLKGFKGEWKRVRLGDIFNERNELGYRTLPLLSVTQDRGIIYQSESDKKDTSNEDKSKYKRICKGDIGYNTMRMWQGRFALSTFEGIISPAYTVVVPKENANVFFFSYFFALPKTIHQFFKNSQGLVSDTLNCKYRDFEIIEACIPPLPEQTAIANILQTADNEINLLQQKLGALKAQKKGLMQQLLTGKKRLKHG